VKSIAARAGSVAARYPHGSSDLESGTFRASKGATRAFGRGHPDIPEPLRAVGQPVLIGGSMGTASYVLAGTRESEALSFSSACHGAGRAMSRHQADTASVVARDRVEIQCAAPDDELLLADWLSALIYEMAERNMLFARFAVRIDGTKLEASACGEPVDRERHHPAVEVKGATYTELSVRRQGGVWVAQTVVDV
jgi:SHS2 domain-containing protein